MLKRECYRAVLRPAHLAPDEGKREGLSLHKVGRDAEESNGETDD